MRGYKESVMNVDNALFTSVELRSPPLSFIGKRAFSDLLQFLLFLDYGLGSNIHQKPDEAATQYLLSYGPGVRYNISPYMTFKADLGIKLHKLETLHHQINNEIDNSRCRFHFAFIATY